MFDWRAVLEWWSLVHTFLIFPIEFMNYKTNLHVRAQTQHLWAEKWVYFFYIPRILINSIKSISNRNSIIYYVMLPTCTSLVGTINFKATTS